MNPVWFQKKKKKNTKFSLFKLNGIKKKSQTFLFLFLFLNLGIS